MEILLAIAGLLLAVILPVWSHLHRKYKNRPRLEIELVSKGGSSSPAGTSSRSKVTQELIDGVMHNVIDGDTAIKIFNLKWNFSIIIRNNSDVTAYYPELEIISMPQFKIDIKKLPTDPILNSAPVTLDGNCSTWEECTGADRTDAGKFPIMFQDIKIELRYKNHGGTVFYTFFDYANKNSVNKLLRKSQKKTQKNTN